MKTELWPLVETISARMGTIRAANAGVAAPELDGQEDHEEGVGAEIGCVGKVGVEGRRADGMLQAGEPWGLAAHQGNEAVAQGIAPAGESAGVCKARRGRISGR